MRDRCGSSIEYGIEYGAVAGRVMSWGTLIGSGHHG